MHVHTYVILHLGNSQVTLLQCRVRSSTSSGCCRRHSKDGIDHVARSLHASSTTEAVLEGWSVAAAVLASAGKQLPSRTSGVVASADVMAALVVVPRSSSTNNALARQGRTHVSAAAAAMSAAAAVHVCPALTWLRHRAR